MQQGARASDTPAAAELIDAEAWHGQRREDDLAIGAQLQAVAHQEGIEVAHGIVHQRDALPVLAIDAIAALEGLRLEGLGAQWVACAPAGVDDVGLAAPVVLLRSLTDELGREAVLRVHEEGLHVEHVVQQVEAAHLHPAAQVAPDGRAEA